MSHRSSQRIYGYALVMGMFAMVAGGCTWVSAARASAADFRKPDSQKFDALYLEARLLMATRQYDAAAAPLDKALSIKGCPVDVYVARAEIHGRDEKGIESANKLLDRGLKAYPNNPDLLIAKAQLAEQAGRVDDAIAQLESVLKLQPNRRSVLERLSQLHLKRFRSINRADQVQAEVKALIDIYQRMLESSNGIERIGPLLVLSSLYLNMQRADEALVMAQEAVSIRPRDPRTHLALASVYQALRPPRSAEALAEFRKALLINPQLEDAIKGAGDILGKNHDKIIEFYRGMATEMPHSVDLQLQYAEALANARRWKQAEAVLLAVLKDHPDSLEASIGLIEALQSQNKLPEALEIARKALHEEPKNELLLKSTGETLRALPNKKLRIVWYQRLAAEFENQKEIQALVARELVHEENWPEAEKQLDAIIQKWPADAPTRLARVRTWIALDKLDKAQNEARELAKQKSDMTTLVSMAVAERLHTLKRSDEALRFTEEMRRMRPDDEGLTIWHGWLLLNMKRSDDAIAMLDQFHKTHPENYEIAALLVEANADLGRYDRSAKILDSLPKTVVEQKGNEILLMRANIDRRRHKLNEALAAMQELVKRDENNAGYHQELGMIYQELGKNAEAEKAYKKAIELDPGDPEYYNTLGYFYAETNQKLDEALKLVTRALQLKPDAGHIVDSLGWVYYQRGDYAKAVEALARAVKMMADRPDPVIFEHLGDAHSKAGETELAREAWRKALELKPEKPELIQRKIEGDNQR